MASCSHSAPAGFRRHPGKKRGPLLARNGWRIDSFTAPTMGVSPVGLESAPGDASTLSGPFLSSAPATFMTFCDGAIVFQRPASSASRLNIGLRCVVSDRVPPSPVTSGLPSPYPSSINIFLAAHVNRKGEKGAGKGADRFSGPENKSDPFSPRKLKSTMHTALTSADGVPR